MAEVWKELYVALLEAIERRRSGVEEAPTRQFLRSPLCRVSAYVPEVRIVSTVCELSPVQPPAYQWCRSAHWPLAPGG